MTRFESRIIVFQKTIFSNEKPLLRAAASKQKKLENLVAAFAISDNIHSHILLYTRRDDCQPRHTALAIKFNLL